MKSMCLVVLGLCAACGSANAVGSGTASKGEVASAASPSDTKTGDKPSSAALAKDGGIGDKPSAALLAKDGGGGGW